MIEFLGEVLAWFGNPDNWIGPSGILNRLREHVQLTAAATVAAAVLAIPPALLLGHRRLGGTFVVALVNIGRAIP
ncbi:MAG: ABC transporter permease, partial [Acidimicrobiia bacterium]